MRSTPVRRIRNFPSGQRGAALIVIAAILILGVAWFTISALSKAASRVSRTAFAARRKRRCRGFADLQRQQRDLHRSAAVAHARNRSAPRWRRRTSVVRPRAGFSRVADQSRYARRADTGRHRQLGGRGNHRARCSAQHTVGSGHTDRRLQQVDHAQPIAPLAFDAAIFWNAAVPPRQLCQPGLPRNWNSDRVIAITVADVMDAIAGPVADRLQRQVAPALQDWYQQSPNWAGRDPRQLGVPFPAVRVRVDDPPRSTITAATTAFREGLLPDPRSQQSRVPHCLDWSNTTVSRRSVTVAGSRSLTWAARQAGPNMQCQSYRRLLGRRGTVLREDQGGGTEGGAGSFRAPIAKRAATTSSFGGRSAISRLTPCQSTWRHHVESSASREPPHPGPGPTAFTADDPESAGRGDPAPIRALTWFLNNNWNQHTYYGGSVGRDASAPPPPSDLAARAQRA